MHYEINVEVLEDDGLATNEWLANVFEVTDNGSSESILSESGGNLVTVLSGIAEGLLEHQRRQQEAPSILERDLRELLSRDDNGEFDRIVFALRFVDSGEHHTRYHAVQVLQTLAIWDGEPRDSALYEYLWGAK